MRSGRERAHGRDIGKVSLSCFPCEANVSVDNEEDDEAEVIDPDNRKKHVRCKEVEERRNDTGHDHEDYVHDRRAAAQTGCGPDLGLNTLLRDLFRLRQAMPKLDEDNAIDRPL